MWLPLRHWILWKFGPQSVSRVFFVFFMKKFHMSLFCALILRSVLRSKSEGAPSLQLIEGVILFNNLQLTDPLHLNPWSSLFYPVLLALVRASYHPEFISTFLKLKIDRKVHIFKDKVHKLLLTRYLFHLYWLSCIVKLEGKIRSIVTEPSILRQG